MKNYHQSVGIKYNPIGPYIPDHSYTISMIGSSGSGNTYA